jgi:hypothetical protein
MKKLLSMTLCLALFLTAAVGTAGAATFTLTSDTSVQLAELETYKELLALFPANGTTDIAAVIKKYEETIQDEIIALDPTIDENISMTLKLGLEGKLSVGQAKQAVDKGLQWYYYAQITSLTKGKAKTALVAGDTATAKIALEQAIELYQGVLQSTAMKRDDYYGTLIQDQLDVVIIPGLLKAVEDGDVQTYNETRQMLDKSLIKIFALAAMKYAVSAPQADAEKAKVEMTEGYFFFNPIYNSLKGGSAADAEYIYNTFKSADVSKLDTALIKKAFTRAIHGKISGYVQKTIDVDLAKGDLATAGEHAMEGNMFLSAEETLIKEALGEEALNAVLATAKQYYDAVKANDVQAAKKHSFEILKVLSKLDGIQLTVGSKALLVNGEEKTVEAAAYINSDTDRTLVPVRFVTEAVGATIDWNTDTNTVTITHGNTEVQLVSGQSTITKNGAVLADVQLDQPMVMKDNYNYIPVRAVSEVLGYKVFYQNGEIVVIK